MVASEIIFGDDLEMYISNFVGNSNRKVRLVLSDALYASEEELTENYKSKIAYFINNVSNWYRESLNAVRKRAEEVYHIEARDEDIHLMSIYVLFEQDEEELYGLGFRVEFDIEHGCGIKIKGREYGIIEVGTFDVAFA